MPRLKKKSEDQKRREKRLRDKLYHLQMETCAKTNLLQQKRQQWKECQESKTDEEKNIQREADRIRKQKKRMCEVPEEKKARQARHSQVEHARRARETPEQRKERQQQSLKKQHERLARETPDEKKDRQQRSLQKQLERIDYETVEELFQRREKAKKRLFSEREKETEEDYEERLLTQKKRQATDRKQRKNTPQTVQDATEEFQEEVKQTPVYVCTSCHRLLRRKTVREMKYHNYDKQEAVQKIVLNEKYRKTHKDGKVYICFTCHNAIKRNKIPVQSQANGLELKTFLQSCKI